MNDDETNEWFRESISPFTDRLAAVITSATAVRDRRGPLWAADSPAMAEFAEQAQFAGGWGTRNVENAFSMINLHLVAAEDHARALCRLVLMDEPTLFVHVVVARAALEACGRVHYLAEPDIGIRRRIARHQTERLMSLVETRQLVEGGAVGDVEDINRRLARIRTSAEELGFTLVSRKGRPPAVGEERPSATRLLSSLMAQSSDDTWGATLYGYYSAVAHGTVYALVERVELADRDGAAELGRVGVSAREVATVVATAQLGFVSAVTRVFELYGWSDSEWEQASLDAATEVRRQMKPWLDDGASAEDAAVP